MHDNGTDDETAADNDDVGDDGVAAIRTGGLQDSDTQRFREMLALVLPVVLCILLCVGCYAGVKLRSACRRRSRDPRLRRGVNYLNNNVVNVNAAVQYHEALRDGLGQEEMLRVEAPRPVGGCAVCINRVQQQALTLPQDAV